MSTEESFEARCAEISDGAWNASTLEGIMLRLVESVLLLAEQANELGKQASYGR